MPSTPPEGEPVPPDGTLPAGAADGARRRAFGIYLHVPFCASRCGYCDFNTYTPSELAGDGARVDPRRYAASVLGELDLAAGVIRAAGLPERPASTVFIGGGTPTLLPASDLGLMLAAVRDRFGLAAGAEVTTEANPDSVTAGSLAALAEHGVTRVSLGMQSAVGHVLATLDRTHDVQRVPQAVAWARAAGLSVSLDLIYGTPGETLGDWRRSLDAALACGPDHVSAYALVVEPGTRLAARVRRGELPGTDEDDLADKYELADTVLAAAGYHWYEVSNWARTPRDVCRHNLGYWRGDDWWGAGPGAHSHVGGVRWWNVRHPADYAARVSAGRSPAQARERLDAGQRHTEQVLLGLRLAEGLPLACLTEAERARLPALAERGLLGAGALPAGRAVLTLTGRLLADGVVRDVLD